MEQVDRARFAASVFEYSPDGLVVIDGLGRILDANRAFADAIGRPLGELLGKDLLQLGLDGEVTGLEDHLRYSAGDAGFWHGEIRQRQGSGEVRWGQLRVSAVRRNGGRPSHYVGVLSDITPLKAQLADLEHMAYHDALTQLPNRVLFLDRLRMAQAQARRSGKMLAVCYLDLDGFKPVNDRLGHEMGDRLLVAVGQRLRYCLREEDTVARLGGDEFALLLGDIGRVEELPPALDRILSAVGASASAAEGAAVLSASVGVALFPEDGTTPDQLLRLADRAMYQAKARGRNGYHLWRRGWEPNPCR